MMNATPTTTTTMTKMPIMNRGAAGELEAFVMANCRSMLENAVVSTVAAASTTGEETGSMYDCKICGRKFKSFQALGGHRASHKKSKPVNSGENSDDVKVPVKFKAHKCKICDAAFSTGEALGGHMRKHKEELLLESISDNNNNQDDDVKKVTSVAAVSGVTADSSDGDDDVTEKKRKIVDDDDKKEVHVMRKAMSSSCKRVCLGLDLDLSLWWKEELLEEYFRNNAVQEDEDNCRKVEEDEGDSTAEQRGDEKKEEDLLKLELSL